MLLKKALAQKEQEDNPFPQETAAHANESHAKCPTH